MKILGVITGRGGSKGIPKKNIKPLCGKPLIAYTIEAARTSGALDRVILSTDDPEIAEIAREYGCEVPFMRPKELAEDQTPTLPVLQHTVSFLREHQGYEPEAVMLLQPTAPLRRASHIREAARLFQETGADSVVSVCEIPGHFSPYWAVVAGGNGWARLFGGGEIWDRIPQRQDFPQKTYSHNGAIYLFKTHLLFHPERANFYGERVKLYSMDAKESVNIDGPEDWEEAERWLKKSSELGVRSWEKK